MGENCYFCKEKKANTKSKRKIMDGKTFEAVVFFGMCAVLIAFGFYVALQGDDKKELTHEAQ